MMIRVVINIPVDASGVEVAKKNGEWFLKYKVNDRAEKKTIDSPFDIEGICMYMERQYVIINKYSRIEYINTEI